MTWVSDLQKRIDEDGVWSEERAGRPRLNFGPREILRRQHPRLYDEDGNPIVEPGSAEYGAEYYLRKRRNGRDRQRRPRPSD